jgi:flagellar basal-body rod protein FlgG
MVDGVVADVLQVADIDEEALVREGSALFTVRQGYAPGIVGIPDIRQGCIETANVDPILETVGLITTQRAYEAFQRVIKSVSDSYTQSMHNVGTTV